MQIANEIAGQVAGGGGMPELSGLVAKLAARLTDEYTQTGKVDAAGQQLMETFRKWQKAERTVPAMAPKMTATTPFNAPVGRADQAALGQMQGAQQGGMPPGGGPQAPQMLAQLAAMRGAGA